MAFTYRHGLSVFEIVAYIPCLIVAVYLLIHHGLSRSAGWYFLVVFSLARIIGGAMDLGTLNDPKNISLYTGSAILTNVGFSPLLLATLGLLSRLVESINKTTRTAISSRHLKLIEMLIFTGVILGIVGGINAASGLKNGGPYKPQALSKVGTILYIVGYVLAVVSTIIVSFSSPHAEPGERRILLALSIGLPLLLIRLIYSCLSTLAQNPKFSLLGGSPTILLCLALLEEFAVTVAYEVVGLTLRVIPKEHQPMPADTVDGREYNGNPAYRQGPPKENVALRIAKRTIIGRMVMSSTSNKQNDVEMESQQFVRK